MSTKTLGKEYPEGLARKNFLKDNCDCVVEKSYMKQFAPDELQGMKEQLSETSIEINDIEIEKKEVATQFKNRLKPLTKRKSELLDNIKKKAKYVKEECFKFVDQEARTVEFYNADGDLIESRPANPDELQATIFSINRKTGTNN